MNSRSRRLVPAILVALAMLALSSCPGNDPYEDLYGIWKVDSVENPSATGDDSHPWIQLSGTALITYVYYTPDPPNPEWRHCTIRSGTVTKIDGSSITFTQDYHSDSVTVSYSYDGTTLSITWPDGDPPHEVYRMSSADALPYPEGDAVSSPCFN
jgi:hypothetical protein